MLPGCLVLRDFDFRVDGGAEDQADAEPASPLCRGPEGCFSVTDCARFPDHRNLPRWSAPARVFDGPESAEQWDDIQLTEDLTLLIFECVLPDQPRAICATERASPGAPFEDPTLLLSAADLDGVDMDSFLGTPVLSRTRLFFAVQTGDSSQLWAAQFDREMMKVEGPEPDARFDDLIDDLVFPSFALDERASVVQLRNQDLLEVLFCDNGDRILKMHRALATDQLERSPRLAPDGLTLYFQCGQTLCEVTRDRVGDEFDESAVRRLDELDFPGGRELDIWVSEDGRTAAFIRMNASGSSMWLARR